MADKGDKDNEASKDEQASGVDPPSQGDEDDQVSMLQQLLARFGLVAGKAEDEEKPEQLLEEVTFEGIAKFMKTDKCKNIIVMTGAGVSTAAGIPDFRSPGTGLYDNLQKYNLPSPMSVFEIGYFKINPEPFYKLAKELYPGSFKPTISHYFVKLLEDKGYLQRIYTQNIDTLERIAGIDGDSIVEAHGTFHTAHCLDCRKEHSQQFVKDEIFKDKIPKCTECEGLVKPDIVFFGESLPDRFHKLVGRDMAKCHLLIVMGTSLVVQPFASLIDRVPDTTPRLLINREKSASSDDMMSLLFGGGGFRFNDKDNNYRDVAWLGNTDDGCLALADLLGWKDELITMVQEAHKKIDDETASDTASKEPSASQSVETTNTTPPCHDHPKNVAQQSSSEDSADATHPDRQSGETQQDRQSGETQDA